MTIHTSAAFTMGFSSQTDKARFFRALHQPGNPFVLANVWDVGMARLLAAMGAQALATTSVGHAFTLGRPDMGKVSREEALAHAAQLAVATPLPLSADLENGYGHHPNDVAETVRQAVAAGLAGCSIEDTMLPNDAPYPFDAAVVRIEAAVKAARATAEDFVITARADGVMNGYYDMEETTRRLSAFEEVGADVLYAPLLPDMAAVEGLCRTLSAPVNVLAAGSFVTTRLADFACIGVARVSLGASLARVSHAAVMRSAKAILQKGDFSSLQTGEISDDIDRLLARGAGQADERNNS